MNDETLESVPTVDELLNEREEPEQPEPINFRLVDDELELTFQNRFEIFQDGAAEGLPFTSESVFVLPPPQMEKLLKQLTVWKQGQENRTPDSKKLREAIKLKMQEHIRKANELSNQYLDLC